MKRMSDTNKERKVGWKTMQGVKTGKNDKASLMKGKMKEQNMWEGE